MAVTSSAHSGAADNRQVSCLEEAHGGSHRSHPPLLAPGLESGSDGTDRLQHGLQDAALEHPTLGGWITASRSASEATSSQSLGQHPQLRALCLHNRFNYCYANSVVIVLLHACIAMRTALFPRTLDAFCHRLFKSSHRHLWDDIAWCSIMQGWANPSQHDVIEFCQFLFNKGLFAHQAF